MHFLADYRIHHAAELKNMRAADVGKAAGAAWRELPPEQREVYERRSEQEKVRKFCNISIPSYIQSFNFGRIYKGFFVSCIF